MQVFLETQRLCCAGSPWPMRATWPASTPIPTSCASSPAGYPDDPSRGEPVRLAGDLRPAVAGDLGDHHFGVIGRTDQGMDPLQGEQPARVSQPGEAGADSVAARSSGGCPGRANR